MATQTIADVEAELVAAADEHERLADEEKALRRGGAKPSRLADAILRHHESHERIIALAERLRAAKSVVGPAPKPTFAEKRDAAEAERTRRGLFGVLPPEAAAKWRAQFPGVTGCRAGSAGDCGWVKCPQIRDHEPHTTGRHCPLDRLEKRDDD